MADVNQASQEMAEVIAQVSDDLRRFGRVTEDTQAALAAGSFRRAKELDKASAENERNGLVIQTAHGDIGVAQIAGLVARRILCWSKSDDHLDAGERFGLIRFGSRLDVFLPISARPLVTLGQTAIAGETVLAEFGSDLGPVVSRRD